MQYLSICKQPDISDFFKGHGPSSRGRGAYGLRYSGGGGVAQVEDKAQRWGGSGGGGECEDITASGIVIEMVQADGDAMLDMINLIIKEQISNDWDNSTIINCFKGKGNATRCGNYRGLILLEYTMKILERIVEAIIR